jgi:hypothetical protein
MGKMGEGFYRGIEPVAVVAVQDTDGLREALIATITRGNPDVPMLKRRDWPPPVTLKYAKVKTWSAFERGLLLWGLEEKDSIFVIDNYAKSPNGMWVKAPEKRIIFPAETSVSEVVDRMITTLQESARE